MVYSIHSPLLSIAYTITLSVRRSLNVDTIFTVSATFVFLVSVVVSYLRRQNHNSRFQCLEWQLPILSKEHVLLDHNRGRRRSGISRSIVGNGLEE